MEVTICTDHSSRKECERVMVGRLDYGSNKISKKDWEDAKRFPRKQWLYSEIVDNGAVRFTVVDNRDGECLVEEFATLDGAMLYLCDTYDTAEGSDAWDYAGAVKGHGGLGDFGPYVIKCPLAFTDDRNFLFGYAKKIEPHGRTCECFVTDCSKALAFASRADAEFAARKLLGDTFNDNNIVSLCKEMATSERMEKLKDKKRRGDGAER